MKNTRTSKAGEPLRTVIITALGLECEAVCEHLTDLQPVKLEQGTVYEEGVFDTGDCTWKVGVAEIGEGNPNAAAETERAISHFKPCIAMFVGIAGGRKDAQLVHCIR